MQPIVDQLDSLIFKGKEKEIKLLDGKSYTIRETNGEDEGILSTLKTSTDGSNIVNFLSRIIVKDNETGEKVPASVIEQWGRNNINFLLLQWRILNHGSDLEFEEFCMNESCEQHPDKTKYPLKFTQDLNQYLVNGAEKTAAMLYPHGKETMIEFSTTSGLKFRFQILTMDRERLSLQRSDDDVNKNTMLTDRKLEVFREDGWMLVTTFLSFGSRTMSEIRKAVKAADPTFEPHVEYSCPKCKTPGIQRLTTVPTFYYPEELT